jgi:hypothetical protein
MKAATGPHISSSTTAALIAALRSAPAILQRQPKAENYNFTFERHTARRQRKRSIQMSRLVRCERSSSNITAESF